MNKIIDRLVGLGLYGYEFSQQLYNTKTIMAGSFPLQCVLDEIYPKSDIRACSRLK